MASILLLAFCCAGANAAVFTWDGGAANGVWTDNASTANWVGDAYGPGNSSGTANSYVFSASGWDTTFTTITLQGGHHPDFSNLTFNATASTPITIHIDGTGGAKLDLNPTGSEAETLTVSSTGHRITASNGGFVNLGVQNLQSLRISGSAVFEIAAPIVGTTVSRGFVKRGDGTLKLTSADSTFSGQVVAGGGWIEAAFMANAGSNSSLGTGNGTAAIQLGRPTTTSGNLRYIGLTDTSTNRQIQLRRLDSGNGGNGTTSLESASATLTLTNGITVISGGTGTMDFSIGGGGNIVVNSVGVSGALNYTKVGNGKVTHNVNTSYSGTTTVSGGELLVNASHTGGGAFAVNNGVLGGTGNVVSANATVAANGTLAPGNSIGLFSIGGDVTLNGTLEIEYDGGNIDFLNVGGNFDIANGTLNLDQFGNALNLGVGEYLVFASYGNLTGEFSQIVGAPNTVDVVYNYQGNNIALVGIPEPSSCILGAFAIAAALLLARKRSEN